MDAIVTHINMDFDSLAAMVAAKKLHPKARIVLSGSASGNVRRFLTLYGEMIDYLDLTQVEGEKIDQVILVDTRIKDRLGQAASLIERAKGNLVIYDHHPKSDDDIDFGAEIISEAGSTTTMLVLLISQKEISISTFEASLFSLGIHEDTGSLTYPTTTSADARALAFLMDRGADPNVISHFLKSTLTKEQHDLLKMLIGLSKKSFFAGLGLVMIKVKLAEYIEDASIVVRKIAELEDADLVFLLMDVGRKVYVIARSRSGEMDIGHIMQQFGGGGHANVGSAVVRGQTLEEIEEVILEKIAAQIKSVPTAGEIMSKPVITIELAASVSEAGSIMARYGFDALAVTQGGKYAGMILRKDVDKAIHHDLSHAPVKGFLSSVKEGVSPKTLVSEVEGMMMARSIGRIPVLEGGEVVGIITRSHIISSFSGKGQPSLSVKPKGEAMSKKKMTHLIAKALSRENYLIIKTIGRLAGQMGLETYLVGGFVRDIILKRPNLDLDIVVEGDAPAFSLALAEKIGGRVKLHKKFGTAIFITKHGQRIDFASARFEHYDHPAALPKVESSSIIYDLSRRDFTVNSMAIKISEADFGELLDPFGGLYDLEEKRLKTLHALSFIEDPTRIFRAVRFERRLKFSLDADSEVLAKRASRLGVVERLSPARLTGELIAVLSQDEPLRLLLRLLELGALEAVHPKIRIGPASRRLYERLSETLKLFSAGSFPNSKRYLPPMMALFWRLKVDEIEAILLKMDISKGDKDKILATLLGANAVLKALLPKRLKDSELYQILERFGTESLIFLHALSEKSLVKERILRFHNELKSVAPALSGKDLIKLGFKQSPLYNLVFRKLLLTKLDWVDLSRKDEIEIAKRFFEREGE